MWPNSALRAWSYALTHTKSFWWARLSVEAFVGLLVWNCFGMVKGSSGLGCKYDTY